MGWNPAQLSEKLAVDPKTVDRWLSTGRNRHQRLRDAAVAAVGVPAIVLWPEAEAATGGVAELVALYPGRAVTGHRGLMGVHSFFVASPAGGAGAGGPSTPAQR